MKLDRVSARDLQGIAGLAVDSGYGNLPVQVSVRLADGTIKDYPAVGVRYSSGEGIMYVQAQERE